jgi:exportin-1
LCDVSLLQHHIQYLESQPADHEVLRLGLENLINISYVDDTEVFKTCLDYWNVFVADIYTSSCQASLAATTGAGGCTGGGSGQDGIT